MAVQFLELEGKRFAVVPEDEYRRLTAATAEAGPPMPEVNPDGTADALEYARYSIAKSIVDARTRAGWSQAELARRAKIRVEVLNRVERAKVTAERATIDKIAKALKAAGQPI